MLPHQAQNPPPPQTCDPTILVSTTELSKDRNWSNSELYKLSSFMLCHRDKFQTERIRKQAKVFAILSRYIKTRNPNQCRNYVHKLLSKFKKYEQIIQFFKESLPSFEENYIKQLPTLRNIVFPPKVASKDSQQTQQQRIDKSIKEESPIDNIELKPTDVSYCDEQQKKQQDHQKEPPQSSNSSNSSKNGSKEAQKGHSSVLDQSFFSSHFPASPALQQKKWKDCHDLFVQWTSKTVNLLEKYQRQRPAYPYFDY